MSIVFSFKNILYISYKIKFYIAYINIKHIFLYIYYLFYKNFLFTYFILYIFIHKDYSQVD